MQTSSVAAAAREGTEAPDILQGAGDRMASVLNGLWLRQYNSNDRSFKIWTAGGRLIPKIWKVRGLEQAAKISGEEEETEARISEERSQP